LGFVLVASANQMLWLNFTPITSRAAIHLHVSQSDIGTLSEIFPLLYVVLAIPMGRALDRWFRPTLAAGAALNAAGALLRLGGRGYGWILAGQIVVALAQPAILNAITGTASTYLTETHRPVGIALGSAGTFVGFITAFILGGAYGADHLHDILVFSAIYSVVALVVLLPTLRAAAAGASLVEDTVAMRELWRDPALRSLAGLVFLGFGVFIAVTTWVETLLKPYGVSSRTTDTLLTLMVVAGVVGSVAIPPVVAARRLQPHAVALSTVAIMAACVFLAVDPGTVSASVALPLIGLLVLPDLPVILELAERRAGSAGGTATAILWLSGNAGGIVVALVVQGLQNSPGPAFGVLAAGGLLALPLCARLRRQLSVGATARQSV
jgi:predicted MFS family arabinose efflux permease